MGSNLFDAFGGIITNPDAGAATAAGRGEQQPILRRASNMRKEATDRFGIGKW
jgi:hypothetical protein